MPYRPTPWVHSQSFQPLVSMTRPSGSRSRNSPEVSLISTRLRISSWMLRSISADRFHGRDWARELLTDRNEHRDGKGVSGHSLGRPSGCGIHQVLHVHPPAPHDRMSGQQVAFVVVAQLEHREQVHVFLVEEDRVVVDAGFAQHLRELGPDLVVAALVLVDGAGLELHAEGVVHLPSRSAR